MFPNGFWNLSSREELGHKRADVTYSGPRGRQPRNSNMGRMLAAVVVCLVLVPMAYADIGIKLDRTHARPNERVRATSSSFFLSLYLAPESTVTGQPRTSVGPPKRKDWIWLGRFFLTRPSFHFRVPRVRAGAYRPVVYCAPCVRGPRGSLIAGSRFYVLPSAR
jgi:hypothetical protein